MTEVKGKCSQLTKERDEALAGQATSGASSSGPNMSPNDNFALKEEVEQLQFALAEKDVQLDEERKQVVAAAEAFIAEREAELASRQTELESCESATLMARMDEAEVELAQLRHALHAERLAKEALLASAEEEESQQAESVTTPTPQQNEMLEKLQSQCSNLEKQLESNQQAHASCLSEATDKLQASKTRISDLEREVSRLSGSLKEMQSQNDGIMKSVAKLQAEKVSLEALYTKTKEANDQLTSAEQTLKQHMEENAELHQEVALLQQRCEDLKGSAAAKRRSMQRERDDLVAALRDRESAKAELASRPVSAEKRAPEGSMEREEEQQQEIEPAANSPKANLDRPDGSPGEVCSEILQTPLSSNDPMEEEDSNEAAQPASRSSRLTRQQQAAQSQYIVQSGLPGVVSKGLLDIPTACASSPMIVRRTTRSATASNRAGLMGIAALGKLPMPDIKPVSTPRVFFASAASCIH